MRHDPLRPAPPRRRELAILRVPIGRIFVPITYDLIHLSTVDEARQATHLLDEVTSDRRRRGPKPHVVDVAVEGLAQSIDKFCHAQISVRSSSDGSRYFKDCLDARQVSRSRCDGREAAI